MKNKDNMNSKGKKLLLETSKQEVSRRKQNRGVSLISLIITIIVIIIIAAIAIYNGFTDNVDEALFSKAYNEFIEVENAITQRGYEHKLDATVYPYENKKAYSDVDTITINNITYGDGYYLVTATELEKLGISGITREYIVNYSTGEVILKEPYYLDEKAVYTKDDMLDIYSDQSVITKAEYDEKKGVNKPVLMDGMLPVKYDGSNWVIIDKNDEEWYDYSTNSQGGPVRYANVMLMDDTILRDTIGREYTNEQLRGMNLENLIGMEVVKEGSMFVWIPRYTYKEESDGTKTIVYSNLTRDYTLNGYTKSPAFYYGEYTGAETTEKNNTGYVAGGTDVTGIWISKYEAGYLD